MRTLKAQFSPATLIEQIGGDWREEAALGGPRVYRVTLQAKRTLFMRVELLAASWSCFRCGSDAEDAFCSVQYPDRKSAATGGLVPELAERRGALVKRLQECQDRKS